MTLSITRRQRSLFFFVSACGYTALFAGLGEPLRAQGASPLADALVTPTPRRRLPSVDAIVVRDPFATSPLRADARMQANNFTDVPDIMTGRLAPLDDTAVPDLPTEIGASSVAPPLNVRATIVGPKPVAYVADGSAMDVVRIGDTIEERRVAKIDLRGIAFRDGSRLDLPSSFHSASRPPGKRTITIAVDDLRRLLQPTIGHPSSSTSTTLPISLASATAATPSPSAAPLQSVDPQGLPAGVDPTPALSEPTPFVYPYPYAPAPHR